MLTLSGFSVKRFIPNQKLKTIRTHQEKHSCLENGTRKIKPKAEEKRFPLWGQELQQVKHRSQRDTETEEWMGTCDPLLPAASPDGRHRARTSRAPPVRLERPRRTAGRRTSGCASPLAHCWVSEPACASLRSGGPRGEGELGRTPEGGGRASAELAGPRGGRRCPGSARQRGRAARCPGLAAATGPASHFRAHAAPK